MRTIRAGEDSLVSTRQLDRRALVLIPVVIVVLDQLFKTLMVNWIGPDADTHRWELAGNAIAFQYVENRGAAFGILPNQTSLLTAISILIAGFGITLMWREAKSHPLTAIVIGMVVGGAVGNIIDRIRLGYVVDYIAVGSWPKFNIADSMVTIGVILLIWSSMNDERTASRNRREEEPDV